MFSHLFLNELANETVQIQKRNEALRKKVFDKGADGKDVVSGSDLSNEAALRALLKGKISHLAFIYGEEHGFEHIDENGSVGGIIDPIDGTRSYTCRIFYSGISVAFVNMDGQTVGGYIVTINNQHTSDLSVWTFDGRSVQKNGTQFTVESPISSIKRACISITSVASFAPRSQRAASVLFRLATERSRGPLSFCSGAMEILNVVVGNLGACINVGEKDVVSHAVAIPIAKCLGYHVRHVFADGDNFDLCIDMTAGTVQPKENASLAVCAAAIGEDIDGIIKDAIEECPE